MSIPDNINDILFVTAFKDIGRNNWNSYKRSNENYYNAFINITKVLQYNLVVYVDEEVKDELMKLTKFSDNIIFKNLKNVDTFLLKFLENDKIIMNSQTYKNKIPNHRKSNPEHRFSEYNLINHSKINFVKDAFKSYQDYKFYSWIDFGYPSKEENIPKYINTKNLPNKIIYSCLEIPNLNNKQSPDKMLSSDKIYLCGAPNIIHKSFIETFEKIYENKIIEFQKNYITDDDQNIILQIYYDNPDLFHLISNPKWCVLYNNL